MRCFSILISCLYTRAPGVVVRRICIDHYYGMLKIGIFEQTKKQPKQAFRHFSFFQPFFQCQFQIFKCLTFAKCQITYLIDSDSAYFSENVGGKIVDFASLLHQLQTPKVVWIKKYFWLFKYI